jgi:hypothetical protein
MALTDPKPYVPAEGFVRFYWGILKRSWWRMLAVPGLIEASLGILLFGVVFGAAFILGDVEEAVGTAECTFRWLVGHAWIIVAIWLILATWIFLVVVHRYHIGEVSRERESAITQTKRLILRPEHDVVVDYVCARLEAIRSQIIRTRGYYPETENGRQEFYVEMVKVANSLSNWSIDDKSKEFVFLLDSLFTDDLAIPDIVRQLDIRILDYKISVTRDSINPTFYENHMRRLNDFKPLPQAPNTPHSPPPEPSPSHPGK